jgi:hypothetical protein
VKLGAIHFRPTVVNYFYSKISRLKGRRGIIMEFCTMRCRSYLAAGLVVAFLSAPRADADVSLTPAQRDQAKTWVRQLGERSYKIREQAQNKLLEMGKAAIPLLEEGAKESDLELSSRCKRLLELAQRTDTEVALALYMSKHDDSRLLKLPSWDRFSKMIGTDGTAKKLYVDMYCAESTMLSDMDRNPREFGPRLLAHLQEIQRNMYTPFGRANPIPHHRVLALLFMATDPNVTKDIQSFYLLNNLFYQQHIQQGFRDNAGSRKLLMAFLEQRNNANTAQQIFYIAKQLGLKEALPMALKSVNDKTVPGYTRGAALLFIGQMGGKEHIKDIEKLLEDTTNLQTVRFGTTTINAQMRDVALASLILLSGQNAQEYNFPYLQQFHGIRADFNLPPYYYGFSDDAGRQTALKKWKDSQAPKKK